MTYAPVTLNALVAYWKAHGGVSLGVVGDTGHVAKGYSYHLGKDQLDANAYSIRTTRDRVGLTNAASAMDFGKLNGTYTQLREFSNWLVSHARRNLPGTSDMREIIYSPDGKIVLRWDRERGYGSAPRGGEADSTHLTHTHISWYRDAEKRDHTIAIRPYFETAPAPSPGGDVPTPSQYLPGYSATIKATSNVRAEPAVTGALIRNITAPETWADILGFVKGGTDTDGGCTTDQWLTRWHGGKWEYTSKCNVTAGPTAPAGGVIPPDATSCKPFTDPLNAQIAQLQADLLIAEQLGAQKEWDRQEAGATVSVDLLPRP